MPSFMIRRRKWALACAVALGLLLSTASCTTQPAFRPYDLVITERNLNLTPLNPQWYSWVHDHRLPSPDFCNGAKPWDQVCTSNITWANASGKPWCRDGHRNWMWSTYEGRPEWESHSGWWSDDDYNIRLYRPDNAGVTASDRDHLLMEFNSDNTIDHFDTPDTGWWHRFHDAVDNSDDLASRMLRGTEVVALGLLGLDAGHASDGGELHPVVAMAVHVNNDPNDDTWAVFAMNWGDEGACGSKIELFPAQLPISFLLRRPGATAVTILRSDFRCVCLPGTAWGFDLRTNRGAELWFNLPDTHYEPVYLGNQVQNVLVADRVHGEIHLRWTVDPTKVGPSSIPTLSPPAKQGEEVDKVEVVMDRLVANMTPAQRAIFDKLAPPPPTAAPDQTLLRMPTSLQAPRMPAAAPALNKPNQLAIPDLEQRRQQVIAALRAAYGGSLPAPFDK
jgi:hypothetical protein